MRGNVITRAIYHPLIAVPSVFLNNLMLNVDFSIPAALFSLTYGLMISLARTLITYWFRKQNR